MITTNSKNLYFKAKSLKNLGYGKKVKFQHELIGYNYRLSNLSSAVGLVNLRILTSSSNKKEDF